MTTAEFLNKLEPERKKLLGQIDKIIKQTNPKVASKVGKMMGQDMILYEIEGAFGYALASAKGHMTLHSIIMYCNAPIHAKYSKLLNKAKFQKGCINFKDAEQMPLDVVKEFMADCAKGAPKYLEIYKARMAKKK